MKCTRGLLLCGLYILKNWVHMLQFGWTNIWYICVWSPKNVKYSSCLISQNGFKNFNYIYQQGNSFLKYGQFAHCHDPNLIFYIGINLWSDVIYFGYRPEHARSCHFMEKSSCCHCLKNCHFSVFWFIFTYFQRMEKWLKG